MQELDDMSRELDETLEKNLEAIEDNADQQTVVIQNMLDDVVNRYDEAYAKINEIINNTGMNVSDSFNDLMNQTEESTGGTEGSGSGGSSGSTPGSGGSSAGGTGDTGKYEDQLGEPENLTNRPVAKIELSITEIMMSAGDTKSVSATVKPSDAKNKTVKWETSNAKVATVSNGTIKGVGAGTCVITCSATDGSGVKATVSVSVMANASTAHKLPTIDDNRISPDAGIAEPKPANGGSLPNPTPGSIETPLVAPSDKGTEDLGAFGNTINMVNDPNANKANNVGWKTSDGDNKPEVGDKVRVNGNVTKESSGKGNSKKLNGEGAKIAKITSGNNRNYQITLESGEKYWATKKMLSGYSKGLYKANKEEWAWTQEDVNGESAPELVVAPDGAILTKIEPGSSVIPNNFAQNLYELGANPSLLEKSVTNQINVLVDNVPSYLNDHALGQVTTHYDSLLTVNGNVDKDALPGLQELLKQSYQYTSQQLTKDARKLGLRGIR